LRPLVSDCLPPCAFFCAARTQRCAGCGTRMTGLLVPWNPLERPRCGVPPLLACVCVRRGAVELFCHEHMLWRPGTWQVLILLGIRAPLGKSARRRCASTTAVGRLGVGHICFSYPTLTLRCVEEHAAIRCSLCGLALMHAYQRYPILL